MFIGKQNELSNYNFRFDNNSNWYEVDPGNQAQG